MTLILIDGNAMAYLAYYSGGPAARADGLPTGAVSGFCGHLFDLLRRQLAAYLPTHGAVVFDPHGPNWRHRVWASYKANRERPHDDLVCQLRIIRELVPLFGLRSIDRAGYEADDLIATYARLAEAENMATIVVTQDKDLMQLVRPGVSIFDIRSNKLLGDIDVETKFGVAPHLVVDVQALAGDATDNVPGVPGIGLKTAAELVNRFGSLEAVLAAAHEIRQPKRRQALIDFAGQALLSRRLVALDSDVPVRLPVDDLRLDPVDGGRLLGALKALEISAFAERLAWTLELDARAVEVDPVIAAVADEMMLWRAA